MPPAHGVGVRISGRGPYEQAAHKKAKGESEMKKIKTKTLSILTIVLLFLAISAINTQPTDYTEDYGPDYPKISEAWEQHLKR